MDGVVEVLGGVGQVRVVAEAFHNSVVFTV